MFLPVTLVLVSDFEPGDKTWQDEIVALDRFLNDRAGTPAQVVVMEARSTDGSTPPVPDAIAALAPRVEVHFVASDRSAALKDAALEHCRHALVAVVEADCRPETGWLAKLVDALDRDPHLDVASSPTVYPGESSIRRVLTVLDRGYLYQGRPGRRRISSNGAVFRREVLEAHPFPTDETNPFVSGHLQHDAMQRAGSAIRARGLDPHDPCVRRARIRQRPASQQGIPGGPHCPSISRWWSAVRGGPSDDVSTASRQAQRAGGVPAASSSGHSPPRRALRRRPALGADRRLEGRRPAPLRRGDGVSLTAHGSRARFSRTPPPARHVA